MIRPADLRSEGFSLTYGKDILMAKKSGLKLLDSVILLQKIVDKKERDTRISAHLRQETFRDFTLFFDLQKSVSRRDTCTLLLENRSFELLRGGNVRLSILDYIAKNRLAWLPKFFIK